MAKFSVEKAGELLERGDNFSSEQYAYLFAIKEGKLREYYHLRFKEFKTVYSDELPEVDVRMLSNAEHTHKCQTNPLIGFTIGLRRILKEEVITDEETRDNIEEFLKSDLGFKVGDPENPERMKRVNTILDKVINVLG